MAKRNVTKRSQQQQAAIRIFLLVFIVICCNVIASYFHWGVDLTKEKRFTLTKPTEKLLRNMQEVAVIDIYLKGKFPAKYQRIMDAIDERLRSLKNIAGNKIVYRYIDPLEGKNEKEQKAIVHDMEMKGMTMMQLTAKDEEDYSLKRFFPYALVQYNGKEMPVLLLENPPNKTDEEKISYSEALLEYKFTYAINTLGKPTRPHIAYITGNGELYDVHSTDMLFYTLPYYYDLDTVDLNHTLSISGAYDAIIVNQPTIPFTGPEKLKIDQYVMHGGHILWVVNSLKASLDSLRNSPQFISLDYGLELDDLLFKYGVRVNNDLVEDKQCAPLPRTYNGHVELKDWVYFPRFNPVSEHPIVRNLPFIIGGFTNSIDTIKASGIKKTILLQSSQYSRVSNSPVRVSLSMMNFPVPDRLMDKPFKNVALLLEGQFVSAYDHRLAPDFLRWLNDSAKAPFKRTCDSMNSMIVTSIGNVFRNEYSTKDGILPLGYYPYSTEFFENKSFLLNCLEYLTDKSGVLEARSKQVKLRMLDEGRVKTEKGLWQILNVGVPILLVLIFASVYMFVRKQKYERKDFNKNITA